MAVIFFISASFYSLKIGEVLVINHLEDVYRKIIGIFIASPSSAIYRNIFAM